MIEYLNNPALLILACEVLVFLLVMNIVLLFLLTRKNNKATRALNSLVSDIKSKSEENKKQIAELLLQPDMLDPDVIKQGMQNLVNGQTQLYKDMIKAIRTQKIEDVKSLGQSVSDLLNSAIKIGRETGEQVATKEAEETKQKLETEKQELTDSNQELKTKLSDSKEENEVLTEEYQRMMNNAKSGSEEKSKQQKKTDTDSEEKTQEDEEEEVIDITASESSDSDDQVIDITSDDEQAEDSTELSAEQHETEGGEENSNGEQKAETAKEVIEDILGIDSKKPEAEDGSDKAA